MSKRKCSFNDGLQKIYPYLEKRSESIVFCRLCSSTISIASGGKNHISTHINTEKHKKNVLASAQPSVKLFMKNPESSLEKMAIAEGIFAFHTVKHSQSFRDMDCTSKIMKKIYDPSFSCARTKCEAVVKYVFADWAIEELKSDLEKSSFISIYCDASNHGNIKVFPILIRYFKFDVGVSVKLLEFKSLGGENSNLVSSYIIETVQNYGLNDKIVAFCADNTNSNFGGCARKGTNNVFTKLKNNIGSSILGIGCAAHIINNTLQTAADCLPVDIETILIKLYSHFHVHTIRVEELKDFCNYVSIEYQQLLGYCKTRWLSLLPAIERFISMFKPLKTYFLSQDTCPVVLKKFFNDKFAEFWLHFLHKQAKVFDEAVLSVEGQTTTIFKVTFILNNLLHKYESRLKDQFFPLELKKLCDCNEVLPDVLQFYKHCTDYLKKWIEPFQKFEKFMWISLQTTPEWKDVQENILVLADIPQLQIDESQLYDEFLVLKAFINGKIQKWNDETVDIEKRWAEIFNFFNASSTSYRNLLKLVEFIMCLPGTNAPTERLFSAMNNIWLTEKTSLSITTLKAMLLVKFNFNISCVNFYEKLISNKHVLKKIQSSKKYSHVAGD